MRILPKIKYTMSKLTTDPNDPDLHHGPADTKPVKQRDTYLVLPEEELAKELVRPFRNKYTHDTCGGETEMSRDVAKTYARDPTFYSTTYCVQCRMHRPVSEFKWSDTDERVGS